MDFGGVGFDSSVLCSNSDNNNISFPLDCSNSWDEKHQLDKWFASGHYYSKQGKRSAAMNEGGGGGEDVLFRELKVAKTGNPSPHFGDPMLKNPFLQRSINVGEGCNQQMLSFSSTAYYQNASGLNGANNMQQGILSRIRAPFTPSQWIELEHQAMIYNYITDNIPIPPHLLNPIRKAFESAPSSSYSSFKSNPLLGWGSGAQSNDPEPGRCRRTDGKKWRCSKDAVGDHKYCERHMNRGHRHRSRKPVEEDGRRQTSNRKTTLSESSRASKGIGDCLGLLPHANKNLSDKDDSKGKEASSSPAAPHSIAKEVPIYNAEFGLVCSDSLLNPLINLHSHEEEDKSKHFLRQFVDDWPENLQHELKAHASSTKVTHELTTPPINEQDLNCVRVPWEASSIGGPLGEVLHANNNGECNENLELSCCLDLMVKSWDHRHRSNDDNGNGYLASSSSSSSSPTELLSRLNYSASNSSAGSSPRGEGGKTLDANRLCNKGSIFAGGIV